jgi:hypothetical protein
MGHALDLRPEQVDIDLYEGDSWSIQLAIPSLGDLTGSTVSAKWKPNEGAVTDLDYAPTDLVNSTFTIGQLEVTTSGRFDVSVTLPASLPRTYITGRLNVSERVE